MENITRKPVVEYLLHITKGRSVPEQLRQGWLRELAMLKAQRLKESKSTNDKSQTV